MSIIVIYVLGILVIIKFIKSWVYWVMFRCSSSGIYYQRVELEVWTQGLSGGFGLGTFE